MAPDHASASVAKRANAKAYFGPALCRDPTTTEEEEYVENLFDVAASCLLLPENKAVFVEDEGAL
jgi:hypothetical protein